MLNNLHQPDLLEGLGLGQDARNLFVPSAWLDSGAAVLDGDGRIINLDEPLHDWLELRQESGAGTPLSEALGRRCSEAVVAFETLFRSSVDFSKIQFHSSVVGISAQQWYVMEMFRSPFSLTIRLASILPPLNELEEATWDEHLRSESSRRGMFMRLVRAESQLDQLMKRWPGVIFRQRPDLTFQFVSPNIEALTGVTVDDWSRQAGRFWEIVHDGDAEELQKQMQRAARSGAAASITYRVRHAQTGKISYVLEQRQPVMTRNGLLLGYEGFWFDVTRQTIAEKRLSTASWKETLAVLTLGMAHDFSNIMAGIHSLSESYLSTVDESHEFAEGLTLIKKNSLQASQMVHRMINLHIGQAGERNYHDLNEIVGDLTSLVRRILPRRVQIKSELSEVQLPIYVDPVEFQQVIINLTLNAADAMTGGGELTLRNSRYEQMPPLRHFKGGRPKAPVVCLEVADTGCGISSRHIAVIFDPFFTTKGAQRGSGLGLYNAQLFVEKHGGAISVESEEGKGTTFKLWLPQATFEETKPAPAAVSQGPRRRQILLVGPAGDFFHRRTELLRSHGYQVLTANSMDAVLETLDAGHELDGAMLLVEPLDQTHELVVPEIQRRCPRMPKMVLQLVGRNADEIDSGTLEAIDLVLASDAVPADFQSELQQMFGERQAAQ
jgi:signal transduction histidine kinase/CheY-like chemotaxis protein